MPIEPGEIEEKPVYIDPDGKPYRRITNSHGAFGRWEEIPLAELTLVPARRDPSVGPWGYYGDAPLLYNEQGQRGGLFSVKDRPTKRLPHPTTWRENSYGQKYDDGSHLWV